jgi:hypothetical protein
MSETRPRLSWRAIGILAGAAAVILAASLYVALRPPAATPAVGPQVDLELEGKLTERIAWAELPASVKWDGTEDSTIPKDLQAVYGGQTLYKLVGLVDDDEPDSFNVALARKGYTIRFLASDGYSCDMDSESIIGKETWIVARLKDGKALPEGEGPYRDVGSFIRHFHGRQSVKALMRIQLVF